MSSSTLPPSLKKISVFLKRAEELDRDKSNPESRVVAYNCRQYAVLTGIPLVSSASKDDDNGAAAKASLAKLLTALEKEKQAMSVFSKNDHWKICRKVADRVFEKADSEDRGGVANKVTARSFYAAGTFYEILQQFHTDEDVKNKDGADLNEDEASVMEHIEEEDQRRIYCKWKATEILNAIKEGRTPTPGGYQQDKDEVVDDSVGCMNKEENGLPMLPPPPPSMPSSDLFEMPSENNTSNRNNTLSSSTPPPQYDGIEISLSGQPTSMSTTDYNVQEHNDDELFIPEEDIYVPPPQKPSPRPPAYSEQNNRTSHTSSNVGGGGSSTGGKGMLSSIFSNKSSSSSSKKKLSKEQMGDAIELTKFAMAALQQGDSELGRERLEQALGIWR